MYAGLRRAIILAVSGWILFLIAVNAGAAQYTYDANGNRLTMTDNTGITSYKYDALNRLIRITNPKGQVMTYTYDAAGRRSSVTYPNGLIVRCTYDAVGQLLFMSQQLGNNIIASFRYTYDNVGNRTSMADQYGTNTYAYDQLSRLIQATHPQPANPLKQIEQYMYDAVGNRIDTANVYNAGNQLLEDANFIYSYDKNGNTISKRDKVSSKYTHYYWDAENKLVRVQEYTNIASAKPASVNNYIYDGYGRRVAKNVNGTISKYVYDNEVILLETDKDDNTLARYTHGPGIDEPLVMDRSGQSYYYVVDGLGSIVKVIGASGNVVNEYVYDAFGNMVEKTAGVPNMFTYTGREYDMELGLYYYRSRYYDPRIGRFLNEDPVMFWGGVNFYAYTWNNPVNFIDPLGLEPLHKETKACLQPYFPQYDLNQVNIHRNSYLPLWLGADAVTIGNDIYFAFFQYNPNDRGWGIPLIGHEITHARQYKWFGTTIFLQWYFSDYFYNLRYMNSSDAYLSIRFEKEAYAYQGKIRKDLENGQLFPCHNVCNVNGW